MENRKKIGLIIIGIAVIVLVIILFLLLKKNNEVVPTTQTPTLSTGNGIVQSPETKFPTTTPGDLASANHIVYDLSKETPHQLDANDAAKMSASFTERLGSFSNQSDYANISDLKIFMTSTMRDWADKQVAELKAANYSGEYYGITTKALTTKVLSYDEKAGTAKVEVITERREGRADVLSEPFRQTMTLELIKNNDQWLVDTAYWEKK